MNKRYPISTTITRSPGSPVSPDEVECLIMWPEDSRGEREERMLIHMLISLANTRGYGRLSQLTTQLEDLWGHPEKQPFYQKTKAAHLSRLR